MIVKNRLHKVISFVIALSMLLQLAAIPAGVAASVAAEPAGAHVPTAASPVPSLAAGAGSNANHTLAEALAQSQSPTAPDALATPLTLSRAQSQYSAGSTMVVTYTLRNNLAPTVQPAVAPTAPITDVVAALAATDFEADPNTVRDVVLTDPLLNAQTMLLDISRAPDRQGDTFAINLGDLPPQGSTSVVLTMTIPATVSAFTDLDGGATAHGNWRARPVSATVAPIRLAPDGLDAWLACTVDANCDDPYVVRKAAQLGNDATAIFAFVRDLGYEAYQGSLRGARGTLWSEAGNGYDQASLLIALLRASGIPAAYREGTLATADAQTLLAGMFPAVPEASGLIPAGADTADPVNDPTLLAEAQAHAWVEAYLPGTGWTALDPAFPNAQPGDVWGTPSGGQLAELPDSVRHKVTMALTVEKYQSFPVGGTNLTTLQPLVATFATVEAVGEPVEFAHLVETDAPPGLVFSSVQHTYTPYFVVGTAERLIEGQPFDELLTSFPLATHFVTAEWLDLTITAPDGSSETSRRELFDDIGYATRTAGGLVGNLQRDETPRLSLLSSWSTLFAPSEVAFDAINDRYQEMVDLAYAGSDVWEQADSFQDTDTPTPEQVEQAQAATATVGRIIRLGQQLQLFKFAAASDQGHQYLADGLLTKAYHDSPRILMVGWERNDQTDSDHIAFDLVRNEIRELAYPGQTDVGPQAFRFYQTLVDTALESQVLAEISPAPVVSVATVWDEAIAQGIPFERITFGTLDELAALPLSDEAKARISDALVENPDQFILVPAQMVLLPGATEPTVGWLEVDNETLATKDVLENGQHGAAIGYAALAKFSQKAGSFVGGFSAGFFGYTMGFWIGFFESVPLGPGGLAAALSAAKASAAEWGKKAEKACVKKSDKQFCKAGVAVGRAVGSALISRADPPLHELLYDFPLDQPAAQHTATATFVDSADLVGNPISATIATPLVGNYGTVAESWSSTAQNGFRFDLLTVTSAAVYSDGVLLDSGAVSATGTPAFATTNGSSISVSSTTTGTLSLHGVALPALGAGSVRDSYQSELSAGGTYTLALTAATLDVGGNEYSGDFVLETSAPATLHGAGATAAPNFAGSTALAASGSGLSVAAGSGSLTVGGNGVSPANGFALGNASGAASITPAGAGDDTFRFDGSADFFALTLSGASSTIPADGSAGFSADVSANFNDSYTLTVSAPAGWSVAVNGSGAVTAEPPVGATADDYQLLVTAQSATYPALFVSAQHTVTLTAVDGVSVDVAPDPVFTVPWGPTATDVANFDRAVGRFQLPNAAFAVTVTNRSSISRTFDVAVTGLPAGWAIFGAEAGNTTVQLPLAAGEQVQLGLYISPTASLPAAGTSFPFDVVATATDDGTVTAGDSDTFTMPGVPYPALTLAPPLQHLAPNSSTTVTATLTNVGTAAGTFAWLADVAGAGWTVSDPPSPVTLNPNEVATATLTVNVTDGEVDVDYPISVSSPAPTLPYTPTVVSLLYLTSENGAPVFGAGEGVAACTGDPVLSGAFAALASALSALESSCDAGACDPGQQARAVDAAQTLRQLLAEQFPTLATGPFAADIAALQAAGDDAAIGNALASVSASASALSAPLCEIAAHRPEARWEPVVAATLPGRAVTYTLNVENQGTVTTTYAITVSLPGGPSTFNETVDPGDAFTHAFSVTPAALGSYDLTADVVATGTEPGVAARDEATARLNVVDRFVQVTAVTADPAFVETGVSSTTLGVDVTNVADIARDATAHTEIASPNGTISYTADVPLTLLAGDPRSYELDTVDTSGWADGVYTITVDLLDGDDALIPDGSGYGYLLVGEGLEALQDVQPQIVAPGTVTVTTGITTRIRQDTILPSSSASSPAGAGMGHSPWVVVHRPAPDPTLQDTVIEQEDGSILIQPAPVTAPAEARVVEVQEQPGTQPDDGLIEDDAPAGAVLLSRTPFSVTVGNFTRYENTDAQVAYSGSWTEVSSGNASNGSFHRSNTAGDTFSLTFTGNKVGVGFATGTASGRAEIFIDGTSREVVDLYRLDEDIVSRYYSLTTGVHTISTTVLGTANPFSSNTRVNLDFVDVWNGAMADGFFEEDDVRVFYAGNWSSRSSTAASGGTYARATNGDAWFPFSGDTVSWQALAYSGAGPTRLYVDGRYHTTVDLYSPETMTRTLSFDGLGAGPHILQISAYRGYASVDAFATPGSAPFYTETMGTGIVRYEEDDERSLYNGVPYTQTATSWNMLTRNHASAGYAVRSRTNGDEFEFTFAGAWLNLGLWGNNVSGDAEIFIDGISQGVVDTYRHEDTPISLVYDLASGGAHTLTVRVLGSNNPLSGNSYVHVDYVNVWDGTAEPDGTFSAELATAGDRFVLSNGWGERAESAAADGAYLRTTNGTAWFHFTGDSVSFRALAQSNYVEADVSIDGMLQTRLNLWNPAAISRTLSFAGLGNGPHVLQVSSYRGYATVDTVTTPGSGPFFSPGAPSAIHRLEEDDLSVRYNGQPFTATATSWGYDFHGAASRGYTARSRTAGDAFSMTFSGPWVAVGFGTEVNGGRAELFIDGVSRGIVDTYTANEDVLTLFYDDLMTATHTLTMTVLGEHHPDASDDWVRIDYVDVWDGTATPAGWFEPDKSDRANDRVDLSDNWHYETDPGARNGDYYDDGRNVWFRFTGDAVTFQALSHNNVNAAADVYIDGVYQETVALHYPFSNSPLPFHYSGLGSGAHVMRVTNVDRARVDAFEADPATFTPGVPMVEWWDGEPAGGAGVMATAAAADIDGDGVVEIAVSSNDGNVYLYRGDGVDTGGGSPLLWSVPTASEPDAPAIAQLDGAGDAEIVVGDQNGIFAYHADGSTYWSVPSVTVGFPAGGASIANLDQDDRPEIVVAANSNGGEIVVLEHDGTVAWRYPTIAGQPAPPVLADLTGDGYPDILALDDNGDTAYALDYGQGVAAPSLLWTHVFTADGYDLRGAPAVADVDGLQPGGDDGPEVIVTAGGFLNVLDADGTKLWATPLGSGSSGGVSVADTDGDGEIELITTMEHNGGTIYAVNADGSILWTAPAPDNTSGTSAAVHDLDGDGLWEVIWNGDGMGLTIYRGTDGAIIFNEPQINSITRKDFPIVADVDGDGHAEIVAGDPGGVYVVGYDEVWAASRPLWNQYNYHVTNVNDDLTIPPQEPDSWLVHNTYRTQTPLLNPAPVYNVAITHTGGVSGSHVISSSFSTSVTVDFPHYLWGYSHQWYEAARISRFETRVEDLAPGDVRALSAGTEVAYTLSGGSNRVALPPLYVSAAHIVAISPPTQTVGAGATAGYQLTLTNPAGNADEYALSVAGLPEVWVTVPPTVTLPAGSEVTVPLTVTIPTDTAPQPWTFAVPVSNSAGGQDQASAALTVVDALDVVVAPEQVTATLGASAAYTLTLTNLENTVRTYDLSATGLANVTLPATVTVGANGTLALPLTATGAIPGPLPFTIAARARGTGASDQDSAVLTVTGRYAVGLALSPDPAVGGPGTPAVFTTTVSNLGDTTDSYSLTLDLPAGWRYRLLANDQAVNGVSLAPDLFNTAELRLLVTPGAGVAPGNYPITATAVSESGSAIAAIVTGTVQVLNRGVDVAISPASTTLAPTDSGVWQVTVTNTGAVADSFWLTATGIVALSGQFSANPVALNPGQSTTVQLSAGTFDFALPTTYSFAVAATSQNDGRVRNQAMAGVTFNEREAVQVAWHPASQSVSDALTATFLLVVTNTGNVNTSYQLGLDMPGLDGRLPLKAIALPARTAAVLPLSVQASGPGDYTIEGTASGDGGAPSASAVATLSISSPTAVNLYRFAASSGDRVPAGVPLALALLILLSWIAYRRRRRETG